MCGEREVGVAAAQVDDPQRVVGGGPAEVALLDRVGDAGVEDPQELLDLAVLRLPAGLHPPLDRRRGPSATNTGSSSGRRRSLSRSWLAVGLDRGLAAGGVDDGLQLLGHPQLVGLGRGLDVPVAERLVEQARPPRPGRRRRPGGWRCGPGWRRTPSTWRCRPALRSTYRSSTRLHARLLALLPSGGHRPHQGVRVEQVAAHPGQDAQERLGHWVVLLPEGRDDDDEEQPAQSHRDDQSAVAGVHLVDPIREQLGEVDRRNPRQVVQLMAARQPVGEHHAPSPRARTAGSSWVSATATETS